MINLASGSVDDIKRFSHLIIDLAEQDHRNNYKKLRSGKELVKLFADQWRGIHYRMATGIYNNARRTIECFNRED